jgi:putative hydrolase of the HAD superfamily
MLSDIRAIAFDLDNTLWDVEPVLERAEQCLAAWLQEHCPRLALSREQMRAAREELARREPHNAHDVSYLRVTALAEAFEVFLAARNAVEIFPDVAPALARLRLQYALASLSNGNADLARIGLGHVFTVSLNARQIGAAKPHPRCFERLAQELALDPRAIAYVGDDPQLDVAAARATGLRTVWMNRRALAWPRELRCADLTVRDCAQLAAVLRV